MSYAHIVDGQITAVGTLPRTGRDATGRAVSRFDRLDPDELAALGWLPIIDDGPPQLDPATQRAVRSVELVEDIPTAVYTVELLPEPTPDPMEQFGRRLADVEAATNTVPDWTQPTGAHDAWPLDAKVNHYGDTYRSLIPANTTEPGSDPRWWEVV